MFHHGKQVKEKIVIQDEKKNFERKKDENQNFLVRISVRLVHDVERLLISGTNQRQFVEDLAFFHSECCRWLCFLHQ